MIDHEHRCIFIHQRKVAGTSIISSFGFTQNDPGWHKYNDGVLSRDWRDRPAEERRYFVFSAVRNPFDRLISAWRYLKSTRDRPLLDVLLNPPREGHDFRHLTRTQVSLLREQKSRKLITDDLIRYERCQEDFDRVRRRLNLPPFRLPVMNVSNRGPDYRIYFDTQTRALAEEMYMEDLLTFGYRFD